MCQHELHVQKILFKCLAKDNNCSLWVQCMTVIFVFKVLISSYKDAINRWCCAWTDHKRVIIISKEMRHSFKCCSFYFYCFKAPLTMSFLVVEEKKWPVIFIITENSGRTKVKIWPIMSVDRLLFRHLLYAVIFLARLTDYWFYLC